MAHVVTDIVQREKTVQGVYRAGSTHMVGDGFPVRNLFPSNDLDREVDPFLMLDYAGPQYFTPTDHPRGVGEHPHRGFETVTIVYEGVLAHRDSTGNGGIIGPGDVQWMTAAAGIVHEELHEKEFAKAGGTLHAIQLWVNLPKASKMTAPGYQTLLKKEIPVVTLADGAGEVRVIAGEHGGVKGPAKTFTRVHLYDVRLNAGHRLKVDVQEGDTTTVFVLRGQVGLNSAQTAKEAELAVYDRAGTSITLEARETSTILILSGEPIREPIARYGPFVMNTKEELVQAVQDYQAGKMGHLS
ncbi:MAG TPA: pirin family protein [Nitrospiraceae bacterium]|nr:pirin family protein [Nitrospiraceae bacterium]